jgi:hypothetical protein
MKKSKKLIEDEVIIQNVLNALGVRIPEFRKKLGYSSDTSIHNVLKKVHGISNDMINKILINYQEVSYLYLKKGEGQPLRPGATVTSQKSISRVHNPNDFINIYDFLKLPAVVEDLKNQVKELKKEVEKIKSGK